MTIMQKKLLIHAWTVHFDGIHYYLPYTHWIYLSEIVFFYSEVSLLSPVIKNEKAGEIGLVCLKEFKNVSIVPLPASSGYIEAIRYFPMYYRAYRKLKGVDTFYARYPVPFGWLQKLFFKRSRRIIHFVGDPVDAAKSNPNFSQLKKLLLLAFFQPEHKMYLWACKGAEVYTNGYHLAERLKNQGISARPLISSTLKEGDYYYDENKIIDECLPKILYIGYLRKAKGVETVIKAFKILKTKYSGASLTVVGSGESESQLEKMVSDYKLEGVSFLGHIDNRSQLNRIIRQHDIFCFASLSEGSPRVILEAMANGINVVSTPVGSIPSIFIDGEDILFADFNDEEMFSNKMIELIKNRKLAADTRQRSYRKVKGYTIKSFIKDIFDET